MGDKNKHISNLDDYQMRNHCFDPTKDAFRVTVVDGIQLNLDKIEFPEQKQLVLPQQEIKVIEVPVIVKDSEIVTIEKPVYITEIKTIEIEKPIIIKDTEIKVVEIIKEVSNVPLIAKICMVVQALALIGILLTKTL